jgi:carbon storage regulator
VLILSRLRGETVVIGDDVRVTVADIRGHKVRLAVLAPCGTAVHREEVYRAIAEEIGGGPVPSGGDLSGVYGNLVLTRKKDEKIRIADDVTVMVIEVRGDKVRLGIDAPREVSVHREEVYNAIRRRSVAAAG